MDANTKLIEDILGPDGFQIEEELHETGALCGPVEIKVKSSWVPTTNEIFRSWTGQRRIWGVEYHGPVYVLGKDEKVYTGSRMCSCAKCQETVEPRFRSN